MKSIRMKFFLMLSSIVIGLILLLFLANNFLLKEYYVHRKKLDVTNFYQEINALDEADYNHTNTIFNEIEFTANVNIFLYDDQGDLVYSSRPYPTPPTSNVVPTIDNYTLDLVSIMGVPGDSLVLRAQLDNGYYIELHSPLSAIQDNVSYFNTFFVYIGLLGIFISLVVSFLLANRFTKPIREINHVAKKIKDLDFSVLAQTKTADEIGELAESINSMAETLAKTFSNLQEELEENKALSTKRIELINNVSHELKTPLALIQGYTEGLQLHMDDTENKKQYYTKVIIEEVQNMNTIIDHLLQIEDAKSHHQEIHLEATEYTQFISTKINKHKIHIKERNLQLIEEYGDAKYVMIDPYWIDRVITNYIVNAIHYCESSGMIKVSLSQHDRMVRTTIFNSFRAFSQKEQKQIWESFTKIDQARSRDVGGHGLGLTIVKSIQEKLGYSYGVRNVEGGVEFYFDVPVE